MRGVEIAKKESRKSDHHTHKLGACIVKKKEVVSKGYNLLKKTHPSIKKYDEFKTIHAEMHAMLRCSNKEKLVGATMVIYREHRNGDLALARSCAVCMRMMQEAGIKRILYTTREGWCLEELNEKGKLR